MVAEGLAAVKFARQLESSVASVVKMTREALEATGHKNIKRVYDDTQTLMKERRIFSPGKSYVWNNEVVKEHIVDSPILEAIYNIYSVPLQR